MDCGDSDCTRAGWSDASSYTISDLTMLRRELVAGFVIGGFASALVPTWFWRSLFVTGHGFWSSLQNVVLEQPGDRDTSNVITVIKWRDADAFAKARAEAAARYAAEGFKPQELIERLGIKAEIANYGLVS